MILVYYCQMYIYINNYIYNYIYKVLITMIMISMIIELYNKWAMFIHFAQICMGNPMP
jgi:hypothetical protein